MQYCTGGTVTQANALVPTAAQASKLARRTQRSVVHTIVQLHGAVEQLAAAGRCSRAWPGRGLLHSLHKPQLVWS